MTDQNICAHVPCKCVVPKDGKYGKYCSEHCKESGETTVLRCDCKHAECR